MPEMYITDMELHLSLFSESMKYINFLAPAAGTVEIHRSNISYLYQNKSEETYGMFKAVNSLLLQSVTLYGVVDNAGNGVFGYVTNSSSVTEINDTTVRIIANGTLSGMVMYVSGNYFVNSSVLKGYIHCNSTGYLFYVAGAGASANITVQNTLMGVNFTSSWYDLALYGITVYMADIYSINVVVYGKRVNYMSPILVVTKKYDTTTVVSESSYYCKEYYGHTSSVYNGFSYQNF